MLLTLPRRQIRSRRRRPVRSAIQAPTELVESRLCLSATSTAVGLDEFAFDYDLEEYESGESLAWADESEWSEFEWIVESTWEADWSLEEASLWGDFAAWDVVTWEFDSSADEFAWDDAEWHDEFVWIDDWETDWLDSETAWADDGWGSEDLILVEDVDSLTAWLDDDWWNDDVEEFPFGDDALIPDSFGDDALLPDEDFVVFEEFVIFETVEFVDFETVEFADADFDFDFEADEFEGVIIVETFEDLLGWSDPGADFVPEDSAANDSLEFEETLIETIVLVDGEIVFGGEVPAAEFDFEPADFEPIEFAPDDFSDGEFADEDFDSASPVESDQTAAASVGSKVDSPSRPASLDDSATKTTQRFAGLGIDEAGVRQASHSARPGRLQSHGDGPHHSRGSDLRDSKVDAARSRFAARLATNHFPISGQDHSATPQNGSASRAEQFTPRELAVRQFREARARIQAGRPVNPELLRAAVMSEAALQTSGPGSVAGWNDAVWSSERLTMALSELPDPELDDTSDEGDVTCAQVVSAAGATVIAGSFGVQFAERRGFDLLRRLAAIVMRRA